MLGLTELKTLTSWCAARSMCWRPISGAGVLLEPLEMRGCWQRMRLDIDDDDFELTTEDGEKLASASDLHSVLDALEGGVAEHDPPGLAMPEWMFRQNTGGGPLGGYVI